MNKEVLHFEELQYVASYPEGYVKGRKYPVIIFLHGAGTRGNDITPLIYNPYFKITEKNKHFPFVSIAPLCSENTWFDMFEKLKQFIKKILTEEYVDPSRIYLMGASMGGYATWQLAMYAGMFYSHSPYLWRWHVLECRTSCEHTDMGIPWRTR